ncbi:MAG: cytochrome c oxidase assembly protein [Alphaproteobacteria bacterium]|nr:cytochrome c oxidase assembly protein [Alphaproteobacteria bacterium]
MSTSRKRGNLGTGVVLAGLVAGMVGLSFAAVPLYRIFCQVTGYAGTPKVAETASATTLDRKITIRFNADTNPNLPWYFRPEQKAVRIKLGEQSLAFFKAENLSDHTITGTAVFNVTPEKAGEYFTKTQCFCFTEQTLRPGQSVDMPVAFYVDPSLNDDPSMDTVETITLSYTFYEVAEPTAKPRDTAQLSESSPSASRN